MDKELEAKIDELLIAADEKSAAWWKQNGFTFSPPPTHIAEISRKWIKILVVEHQHDGTKRNGSVYGFVCAEDGSTKTLGTLKRGDIHKAATYKAPAKHARGNVFAANFRDCLTAHGIVYLQ